jgi:anti-sigma B factor antagonist
MMSADTPPLINHCFDDFPPRRGPAAFAIDHRELDERTAVVAVEGDLDLASAPMLKRVLVERLNAGSSRLVIDLSRVRFIDSTALGVLVGVQRKLGADERLALAGAPTTVRRVIEVSGLAATLQIFPTLKPALAYVGSSAAAGPPAGLPLTGDVTLMLGIASTALPFAESVEDEAERWLRLLRRHGEAGALLVTLGVSEARIERPRDQPSVDRPELGDSRVINSVVAQAARIAARRESPKVTTTDVLLAVIDVYGDAFDRVLRAHGGDIRELTSRLGD